MADKSIDGGRGPEKLLEGVNRSIFLKALVISTVAHLVFTFGTSFSLYAKWAEHGMFREGYGLLSPSEIRTIEERAAKEKRQEEQEAELAARLEEQRKEAELQVEEGGEDTAADPTPQPTEQPTAPEIEPLPPAEGFSLDDIGLE